ncbi:MAG: hypothetical protein ACP5C4_03465 [Methanomicrobiales archaeon]
MSAVPMDTALPVIALVALACMAIAGGCVDTGDGAAGRVSAMTELMTLQGGVAADLASLGDIAGDAADAVSETDGDWPAATADLDILGAGTPPIHRIVYIDETGTVRCNQTGPGPDLVGEHLTFQKSVADAIEEKVPVMTDDFELTDGTRATALYYPVFDAAGLYRGFVSVAFVPADLIRPHADGIRDRTGFSVMAAQPDGLILYDPDPEEIGTETFTNPMYEEYPQILAFARTCAGEWSGRDMYTFPDIGFESTVTQEAVWTTVPMWENEWRVFVMRTFAE